jgi:hypothetical protein
MARNIYDDISQAGNSNTEHAREFFSVSSAEFVAPADKYSAWDAMLVSNECVALVEVKMRQVSLDRLVSYGSTLFFEKEKYDRLMEEKERLERRGLKVRCWYLNTLASGESFLVDDVSITPTPAPLSCSAVAWLPMQPNSVVIRQTNVP